MTPRDWEKILERMRDQVSEQAFETWLKPLRFVSQEGPLVLVATPHKFFKEWIEENYIVTLEELVRLQCGAEATLEVMVGGEEEEDAAVGPPHLPALLPPGPKEAASLPAPRPQGAVLDPKYTFERFVVGEGNQFAHAAAYAVATNPAQSYNPLFLYGGTGLGKTHLLHAIGNLALESHPRLKLCYITAEKFTNELIYSLRQNRMTDFKEKYRGLDMLLVDDIQFIAGKARTQEEFFHTFNELYSARKQIVVSSDKFPKDIPDLEERIQSRFEWGLVADIQPPDLETRVAILNRKAESERIPLPQDVCLFLASSFKSNIRELEGSLIRVSAHASLTQRVINLDLAREVLSKLLESKRDLSPDLILKTVADHFGVKVTDLRSGRKHKVVALPRQVAMYLIRQLTGNSFPDIGQRLGGRDHSTVMYAVKTIEKKIRDDVSLRGSVETIRKAIGG